jgi:hypothetical protein
MNDDIRILSMLLRFSQRRMIAVPEQVYAHVGNSEQVVSALTRLQREGLIYVEGPSIRLSLSGFARAVAWAPTASVHRLGRARSDRSRAA